MNTLGKILVLLNLLLALGTGAFMLIVFANGRAERRMALSWEQAARVAVSSRDAYRDTAKLLSDENNKLRGDMAAIQAERESEKGTRDASIANVKKQLDDQTLLAQKYALLVEKAESEVKRMLQEVQHQIGVVKEREGQIVTLQQDIIRYRNEAVQKAEMAKAAIDRAQSLLKILQEKERIIAEHLSGKGTGPKGSVADANYENPPPAYVKGSIQKIDARDRSLVEITIGSDSGLQQNHTLEVYRFKPQAEYLGRVRILETFPQRAIARIVRTGTLRTIQEGDEVASSIR